jgi:L-amino acid N-acyltransferase
MMQIRLVQPSDAPSLCEIYNHAVLNSTATMDTEPRSLEAQLLWIEKHDGNPFPAWVMVNEHDMVVGYASLSPYNPKPGYRTTAEVSVYVHFHHRAKGIGHSLLEHLLSEAPKYNFVTLISLITSDNQISLRLHHQLGFSIVGTLTQIARKFDKWVDVVILNHNLLTKEASNSDFNIPNMRETTNKEFATLQKTLMQKRYARCEFREFETSLAEFGPSKPDNIYLLLDAFVQKLNLNPLGNTWVEVDGQTALWLLQMGLRYEQTYGAETMTQEQAASFVKEFTDLFGQPQKGVMAWTKQKRFFLAGGLCNTDNSLLKENH